MGLKEPGLRGSLRNVSVGIDAIPDSVENYLNIWYPMDEGSDTILNDELDVLNLAATWPAGTWHDDANYWRGTGIDLNNQTEFWQSDSTFSAGSEMAAVVWFDTDVWDENNNEAIIFAGDEPGNIDSNNGWALSTREDLIIWFVENGSTASSGDITDDSLPTTERLFAGINVSGTSDSGSADIFIWDESEKLFDETGISLTSAPLAGDNYHSGGGFFNGDYWDGKTDAVGYLTDGNLSESEFGEIWEDTRP